MKTILHQLLSGLLTLAPLLILPTIHLTDASSSASIGALKTKLLEFSGGGAPGDTLEETRTGVRRYVEQSFRAMTIEEDRRVKFSTQQFYPYKSQQVTGTNFILLIPGRHYQTPEDTVYLLGAHYGTVSGNTSVNNEGSGLTALLETIQHLAELRKDGCTFRHTFVAVAFDYSCQYIPGRGVLKGSEAFVQKKLPSLLKGGAQLGRAYILGSLLNYQPLPRSQTMPNGFPMLPVPLVKVLQKHRYTGDFILAISRHMPQLSSLLRQWNSTSVWDTCDGQGSMTLSDKRPQRKVPGLGRCFLLHLTPLLFQGGTLHPTLYQVLGDYPWLVYGDHMAFWADTKASSAEGLPAVFLTDTANLRAGGCYKESCADSSLLTDSNLRLLLRTIRTITDSLVDLTTDRDTCADKLRPRRITCGASIQDRVTVHSILVISIIISTSSYIL